MEVVIKTVIDLPENTVAQIRKLIEDGKYSSISNFVHIAAENQLTLENENDQEDVTLYQHSVFRIESEEKGALYLDYPKKDVPVLPVSARKKGEKVWEDWIWGQINRIFPIKIATRVLAIESATLGSFPALNDFRNLSSDRARQIGKFLEGVDKKKKNSRDEKLSTGLPVGKKVENSLDRYRNHFVGYVKADGSTEGAMFDFVFANTKSDNGVIRVGLTNAGKQFASLTNPILDSSEYANTLSIEEIKFFVEHIKKNVPGERSLFRILIDLLGDGVSGREELNNRIAQIVEPADWSKGVINTQRAGAISRMYELGLIEKTKIGLEVRYALSNSASRLFGGIIDDA